MTHQTDAEFLEEMARKSNVFSTDAGVRMTPEERDRLVELARDGSLGNRIVAVLSEVAGDSGTSEGAVECAQRIIRERADLRTQLASRDEELRLLRQLESHIRLLDPARNSLADALAWLQSTLQRLDALRARRKERP